MVLLEFKESLKSFYGRFAAPVNALGRFCLSLAALILMNRNLGYVERLQNPLILIGLAAVCSVLPYGAISFLLGAVLLGHIYAVSLELALLAAVFLVVVALLYFGLQPRDSYWLLLTPVAFALRVPFVVPLLAGLSGSLSGVIPTGCGVVVYYIMQYTKQNAAAFTGENTEDVAARAIQIIRGLISNPAMFVMIAACCAGILIVYLIRTLSVDYAWILAIVLGTAGQVAVVFAGDSLFDAPMPMAEVVLGAAAALAVGAVYHFFVFAVDYSRTEYTQFEDDDYVYYVKAVPKVVVSRSDVRVQRMNDPRNQKNKRNRQRARGERGARS